MNDQYQQFKEAFDELFTMGVDKKIFFLQTLLSSFTIAGRAIWSDETTSDKEKVEAFKWQNELCHRIWNIISELQQGEDNDSVTRLHGNMKFYGEQSKLLQSQLVPTLLDAYRRYKSFNH
jgi:hypothetical protein